MEMKKIHKYKRIHISTNWTLTLSFIKLSIHLHHSCAYDTYIQSLAFKPVLRSWCGYTVLQIRIRFTNSYSRKCYTIYKFLNVTLNRSIITKGQNKVMLSIIGDSQSCDTHFLLAEFGFDTLPYILIIRITAVIVAQLISNKQTVVILLKQASYSHMVALYCNKWPLDQYFIYSKYFWELRFWNRIWLNRSYCILHIALACDENKYGQMESSL